ncbi:cellulose-binding protein [Streptomyces rhizosphaerihabitans]|uniref:cellulose-binding protein n=1 Tax=Streptomyces rhizosphaerihabitans TaxID=1266770 RepID=UPI0021BDF9B7|nr:cellulose-binding protein [Streptomyces rhizosphaerihabitans]MCT9005560.1 cellulose-binding protein [Streptomyces rhizosphaerihabitans]
MSSTSVSPHGFVAVRGRGYRPEQVDAYAAALSRGRDAAWERAARLTVLAKDMEAEAERMREAVTRLAPQTYEELGERARRIFQLAEEEAGALREEARREALSEAEEAEAAGREVREAAQAYAEEVRVEAEEWALRRLLDARAEADEVRISARRDVKENRGEMLTVLREVRRRAEVLVTGQDAEQTARWAEAERADAERQAAFEAHHVERAARAEESLARATRALAEAEESDRHRQEDAAARAAELLAEARVREERIARETDRVLREHGERWDHVRAHMDHVQSSLTSLTGRAPAE